MVLFFMLLIIYPIFIALFWSLKAATPGKMLFKIIVVDEKEGRKITIMQSYIRYFSLLISIFVLFLGVFWIIWDKKKKGWHDYFAGTSVVRLKKGQTDDIHDLHVDNGMNINDIKPGYVDPPISF